MPSLLVDRVLEEEYAFLHPTAGEDPPTPETAAQNQPTLYNATL
jgi:hypothetical protein